MCSFHYVSDISGYTVLLITLLFRNLFDVTLANILAEQTTASVGVNFNFLFQQLYSPYQNGDFNALKILLSSVILG